MRAVWEVMSKVQGLSVPDYHSLWATQWQLRFSKLNDLEGLPEDHFSGRSRKSPKFRKRKFTNAMMILCEQLQVHANIHYTTTVQEDFLLVTSNLAAKPTTRTLRPSTGAAVSARPPACNNDTAAEGAEGQQCAPQRPQCLKASAMKLVQDFPSRQEAINFVQNSPPGGFHFRRSHQYKNRLSKRERQELNEDMPITNHNEWISVYYCCDHLEVGHYA